MRPVAFAATMRPDDAVGSRDDVSARDTADAAAAAAALGLA